MTSSLPDSFHDNRIQWTISWFREWSNRNDSHDKSQFFRLLAKKVAPDHLDGLFASMDVLKLDDCPRSILEIRLDLISEWFDKFSPEQREYLFQQLTLVDPEFMVNLNKLATESRSMWNQSQRDAFLKDLITKAVPDKLCSLLSGLESLNVRPETADIFQLQLRLFTKWFSGWSDKDRNAFLVHLEAVDAGFIQRFTAAVAETSGQP